MSVRLLIVEDEVDIRERYRELLDMHPLIDLVGESADQEEAWKILQNDVIDAMILDLELPSGSGLLLLEKIKTLPKNPPFIIVVTHVASHAIFDAIRGLGVDYICSKNDINFSYDTPLSVIEIATPFQVCQADSGMMTARLNQTTLRKTYEKRIRQEFAAIDFPDKLQGTVYAKEAVLFMVMNYDEDVCVTKDIYPHIAARYSTTIWNVERLIRNAIEKVWLEKPLYKIKDVYTYEWDSEMGRPTNGDFIRNMSHKIIRQ